jgi:hypothetical protein
MHVTGNTLRQCLGFQLWFNELIIHNEHCSQIIDVQLVLDGEDGPYLHYNAALLFLYAKKVGLNQISIALDHKHAPGFSSALNVSLTCSPTLIIKWSPDLQLDEPVEVAAKTLNRSLIGRDDNGNLRTCLQFPVDNLGRITAPEHRHYSLHRNSHGFVEGYWWDGDWQHTSLPIPLPADVPLAQRYVGLLREIVRCADERRTVTYQRLLITANGYLGYSRCRICKCRNGCREIGLRNSSGTFFSIPEGLIHYVEQHNIHISPKLIAFLDDACD